MHPFEATEAELLSNTEHFVDEVFGTLESAFLLMPKGSGYVDYPTFESGYERLKRATEAFNHITPERIVAVAVEYPIAIVVLRSMLGFTPPEWGYITTVRSGVEVSQNAARSIDGRARRRPTARLKPDGLTFQRLKAMVEVACELLNQGAPESDKLTVHRLEKADTKNGPESIRLLSTMGAPYAVLLYERYLGRPFAGHKDSVSGLVGDVVESVVEDVLTKAGVSYRKTKRAEKVPGFDQAPDFIIPDEHNPRIVIEAKLAEDDGTARDKVTRVQHLHTLSLHREPKFEVIACIAGRGFKVRREDMRKLLFATEGKVFTLKTLDKLVDFSAIATYRTKLDDAPPTSDESETGTDEKAF